MEGGHFRQRGVDVQQQHNRKPGKGDGKYLGSAAIQAQSAY